MQRSYSKKAFPWDNACIESFHAIIKREWLNRFKILNYNHCETCWFCLASAGYFPYNNGCRGRLDTMAVTLKTLAEHTGFSIATIPRVLNNDPTMTVSEETRRMIFDTAHKLGYTGGSGRRSQRIVTDTMVIGIADGVEYVGQLLRCLTRAALVLKLLGRFGASDIFGNAA